MRGLIRMCARPGRERAVVRFCGRACLATAVALGVFEPAPTRAASPAAAGLVQAEFATPADTIRVAAPTGRKAADRSSIIAAIEAVRPGGVVRFASGTYLVGELIRVPTSSITLQGHPDGTTLRGCAPEDFGEQAVALFACNGLELTGAHQTVRGLTFEYAWHGLFIGCCSPADMAALASPEGPPYRLDQPGGHVIEGNTFRSSANGLRVVGQSADPIVIRDNAFRNTFHALVVNGGTVHVLDNEVSAPEPERLPVGHPGGAIIVAPIAPVPTCGRNVIARNRIDGHTDGILVTLLVPGIGCRGTVIRDNTIITREVRYSRAVPGIRIGSPSDSSLTGVPIALANGAMDSPSGPGSTLRGEGAAVLDSTVIEGNRIVGGSGLGIEVLRSSGNRIANNTITDITRRDPFPGNTVNSTDPGTAGWQAANGAGIWISPGSDGNEIVNNTVTDVAGHTVVLAGDDNVVQGTGSTGAVLDLGAGNRVVPGERESPEGVDLSRAGQERRAAEPLELARRMVDVDGHAMRVATAGLRTRRPGEPVVVFENGATSSLEEWGDVPARVGAFAPVLAYDRATVGQSEWDGVIGTPSHVTERLWALLRAMDVEPPYVLVGWSWGALMSATGSPSTTPRRRRGWDR